MLAGCVFLLDDQTFIPEGYRALVVRLTLGCFSSKLISSTGCTGVPKDTPGYHLHSKQYPPYTTVK